MGGLQSRADRPSPGSLFASGPRSWGRGRIWIVLGPVFAACLVAWGAVGIGPGVSAALGHGARGYFVAERASCGKSGCTWTGEFRLPDGAVTRPSTQYLASHPGMTVGTVVPALDTGDPFEVFAQHSSRQWLPPSLFLLLGAGLLAMWAWTVPGGAIRRRRAASAPGAAGGHQDRGQAGRHPMPS